MTLNKVIKKRWQKSKKLLKYIKLHMKKHKKNLKGTAKLKGLHSILKRTQAYLDDIYSSQCDIPHQG